MNIISWNVNGLRAVGKKGLLDFMGSEGPDLFCVQETKIQRDYTWWDLMPHVQGSDHCPITLALQD